MTDRQRSPSVEVVPVSQKGQAGPAPSASGEQSRMTSVNHVPGASMTYRSESLQDGPLKQFMKGPGVYDHGAVQMAAIRAHASRESSLPSREESNSPSKSKKPFPQSGAAGPSSARKTLGGSAVMVRERRGTSSDKKPMNHCTSTAELKSPWGLNPIPYTRGCKAPIPTNDYDYDLRKCDVPSPWDRNHSPGNEYAYASMTNGTGVPYLQRTLPTPEPTFQGRTSLTSMFPSPKDNTSKRPRDWVNDPFGTCGDHDEYLHDEEFKNPGRPLSPVGHGYRSLPPCEHYDESLSARGPDSGPIEPIRVYRAIEHSTHAHYSKQSSDLAVCGHPVGLLEGLADEELHDENFVMDDDVPEGDDSNFPSASTYDTETVRAFSNSPEPGLASASETASPETEAAPEDDTDQEVSDAANILMGISTAPFPSSPSPSPSSSSYSCSCSCSSSDSSSDSSDSNLTGPYAIVRAHLAAHLWTTVLPPLSRAEWDRIYERRTRCHLTVEELGMDRDTDSEPKSDSDVEEVSASAWGASSAPVSRRNTTSTAAFGSNANIHANANANFGMGMGRQADDRANVNARAIADTNFGVAMSRQVNGRANINGRANANAEANANTNFDVTTGRQADADIQPPARKRQKREPKPPPHPTPRVTGTRASARVRKPNRKFAQ